MSTMTLEQLRDDIEAHLKGRDLVDRYSLSAWFLAIDAELTSREAKGDGLVGYVHPALLDRGALAIEVSPVRLSDAQVPVYTHPAAQEAAKPVEQAVASGVTVVVEPVAMADFPHAHQVRIVNGGQRFDVGMACDTMVDAEWYADQLRVALNQPKPEQAVGDGVVVALRTLSPKELREIAYTINRKTPTSFPDIEAWMIQQIVDSAMVEVGPRAREYSPRPAVATPAEVREEDFIQRLRGRAQFLRDRGEVKSPELLERAAAALAAQPSAVGVPEGFDMKPREPTPEMFKACDTIIQGYGAKLVWQRMYDAAPSADTRDAGNGEGQP